MVLPHGIETGDLRISDGIISEISTKEKLEPRDNEYVHDADGLHLLPGIIDPQVHFRDPESRKKRIYTPALELLQVAGYIIPRYAKQRTKSDHIAIHVQQIRNCI